MSNSTMLGVARRKITPPLGSYLYGYNPFTQAESVLDDLNVTAFVFSDGKERAAIISAEVCSINSAVDTETRNAISALCGIDADKILLCATHTHTGPNLSGSTGWGDFDRPYYEAVFLPQLKECIKEACEKLISVKMGVAYGDSFTGINRRETNENFDIVLGQNKWGYFNPKMTVISFVDEDNKPVANMIHYGCHATSLGCVTMVSRDWPGIMTDKMERRTGAISAFFNGFEGDVGPRLSNGKTTAPYRAEKEEILTCLSETGEMAARDALDIYSHIKSYTDFGIKAVSCDVNIPLSPRISREEAEAGLKTIPADAYNFTALKGKHYKDVIASYEEGFTEEENDSFIQPLLKLGDVAFIGFPYECFSQIGMLIQKFSKLPHTLPLCNTNGTRKYFPCEEDICRGGYEIITSRIGTLQAYRTDADKTLVKQTLENIKLLLN
ncbi:MAG: hypothetical protein E7587_03730 [Ruminococcaceae bacterium]|nr:hypothetical protein [Oscillospiraceae bacterium]